MVVHHWPEVLPLKIIKSAFLKNFYVARTHESTNSHEVIPSKQDSTATNKASRCHPFYKRLREPRLSVASFAHGGYTNQASFSLEISILHSCQKNNWLALVTRLFKPGATWAMKEICTFFIRIFIFFGILIFTWDVSAADWACVINVITTFLIDQTHRRAPNCLQLPRRQAQRLLLYSSGQHPALVWGCKHDLGPHFFVVSQTLIQ